MPRFQESIMQFISKIFGIRLFSRQKGELYSYLRGLLGTTPHNIQLYEQALTHKSAQGDSNERLEYLGDALIGMVVAEELYHFFPNESEGFLTRARANIVCRENLNKIAHETIPGMIPSSADKTSIGENLNRYTATYCS